MKEINKGRRRKKEWKKPQTIIVQLSVVDDRRFTLHVSTIDAFDSCWIHEMWYYEIERVKRSFSSKIPNILFSNSQGVFDSICESHHTARAIALETAHKQTM